MRFKKDLSFLRILYYMQGGKARLEVAVHLGFLEVSQGGWMILEN